VVLVYSHDRLPGLARLATRWMRRWPQVIGVVLNIEARPSNVILGPESHLITGRGWLEERFAGQTLRIGAGDVLFRSTRCRQSALWTFWRSAYNSRPGGNPLDQHSQLIDAYCGIGTFIPPLAARAAPVLGLEQNRSSVHQAKSNALCETVLQGAPTSRLVTWGGNCLSCSFRRSHRV